MLASTPYSDYRALQRFGFLAALSLAALLVTLLPGALRTAILPAPAAAQHPASLPLIVIPTANPAWPSRPTACAWSSALSSWPSATGDDLVYGFVASGPGSDTAVAITVNGAGEAFVLVDPEGDFPLLNAPLGSAPTARGVAYEASVRRQ